MSSRLRRRTSLTISATPCSHTDSQLRGKMMVKFQFKKTQRTSKDGGGSLNGVRELPAIDKLVVASFADFLSLHRSEEIIAGCLHSTWFDGDGETQLFVSEIASRAHEEAKKAVSVDADTVTLKAEFYHEDCMDYSIPNSSWHARDQSAMEEKIALPDDFLEPGIHEVDHGLCMVCLMVVGPKKAMAVGPKKAMAVGPKKAAKRMRCGHLYHKDCIEFYTKHNIDCPLCHYNSCYSSLGLQEFAAEIETKKPSGPDEICFVCPLEFGSRKAAKCMGCGHSYHEDCIEYYTKRKVGCPACHFNTVESVRKLASEKDHAVGEESPAEQSQLCTMCLMELGPQDSVNYMYRGHIYTIRTAFLECMIRIAQRAAMMHY